MEKLIDYNSFSKRLTEPTTTETIEINFSDVLEPYKNVRKAQEGDIREFAGNKYQKKGGKWLSVKDKTEKKEYSIEELKTFARSATYDELIRHTLGGDEKMRIAANSEMVRRKKEERPKQVGESNIITKEPKRKQGNNELDSLKKLCEETKNKVEELMNAFWDELKRI